VVRRSCACCRSLCQNPLRESPKLFRKAAAIDCPRTTCDGRIAQRNACILIQRFDLLFQFARMDAIAEGVVDVMRAAFSCGDGRQHSGNILDVDKRQSFIRAIRDEHVHWFLRTETFENLISPGRCNRSPSSSNHHNNAQRDKLNSEFLFICFAQNFDIPPVPPVGPPKRCSKQAVYRKRFRNWLR
jgi:hypothetical protein